MRARPLKKDLVLLSLLLLVFAPLNLFGNEIDVPGFSGLERDRYYGRGGIEQLHTFLEEEGPLKSLGTEELTLFVIPPPKRLDWESPAKLLRSLYDMQKAAFFEPKGSKHKIGHVFVSLRSRFHPQVLTGMTTYNSSEEIDLVKSQGYGIGVLTADLRGKLDAAGPLAREVALRLREGRIGYIRFAISDEMSIRLWNYYKQYCARGMDEHYGGANRPIYGEGGGCSAFGVSFIEAAGLMKAEYQENWKFRVNLPRFRTNLVCSQAATG